MSQSTISSEPELGPSDDLYNEVLEQRGLGVFSEDMCFRLLLLVQRLCLAYVNFYKLHQVASTLKDGDNPACQGQMNGQGQEANNICNPSSGNLGQAVTLHSNDSIGESNTQNVHVERLLDDLRVCQRIKYHLQDFKSHLLKISGKSNLDFCKGQLLALDLIFRV